MLRTKVKLDSKYNTDLQKLTYLHCVWDKYNQFIHDFEVDKRINFFDLRYIYENELRTRQHEPEAHEKAKEKIFDLFNHWDLISDYLILTEVENKYNEGLKVFDKGQRDYALDCLVINKRAYSAIRNLVVNHIHILNQEITLKEQKQILNTVWLIKHEAMFAVEVDGRHSDKKDEVRDQFFFENYNIPTVRYEVSELESFYKKYKGKRVANKKHMLNFSKSAPEKPYLDDITIPQIVGDVKANYYLRMT